METELQPEGRRLLGVFAARRGRRAANHESQVARKIEQSISYMLQHVNQPLQVATLAAVVNVSPSHYSALFKRWMGCPPIDYFIQLRMRHARQLFDNTSLNVKEVAAALGYDDPFYFSRTFKAINRIAPSEYRLMPKESRATIKSTALPSDFPPDRVTDGDGLSLPEPVNGLAAARWGETSTPLPGLKTCKEKR